MKKELKNGLSLSHHLSKYPLIFTAIACLFCASFTQRHQMSQYTKAGENGVFSLLPFVPAFALLAVMGMALVGAIRAAEEDPLKRGVYIGAGFCLLFLCGYGMYLASSLVFDLCMAVLAILAAALCVWLYIKKRLLSTALAAVVILALGMFMGFGVWLYSIAVLIFALSVWCDNEKPGYSKAISSFTIVACALIMPVVYSSSPYKPTGIILAGVILCLGGAVLGTFRNKWSIPTPVVVMFCVGLLVRLGYVFYVSLPSNQHDVFSVFNVEFPRHNTYIMHIYDNWSLPVEKVYNAGLSQYYHPPLYHFLAALWMKAQTLCGINVYTAYENIQYLTMFCSAAMMTVSYKLFCEFKLKGMALYCAFAVIAFHPTFYILSGSINNDPLTTLFLFLAVLYTVRWYKNPDFKNTLLLAISIGGGMMCKLSGAMVAVGTAYVMLLKLFDMGTGGFFENIKKFWTKYLAFGAVCFPLGLWWPLRCYFKYDMPFGYVPSLSEKSAQYVGNYSFIQRLTGIGSWSLSNPYPNVGGTMVDGSAVVGGGSGFFDYGIAPYTVKSSLFGEYFHKGQTSGMQNLFAYAMVFSALVLIGISLYAMVKKIISGGDNKVECRFLLIYYLALVGSYVLFCFKYPHTCTMDFRYIVPTLLIGAVFTGLLMDKGSKTLRITNIATTAVFCVSSVVFYLLAF